MSFGPPLSRWRSLRQPPEFADQAQAVEGCLVLVARVRLPVGFKPIAVPRQAKFDDLSDWNCDSRLTSSQPPRNMLLRPEEVHRRSSENDVVPPLACRDQAVEQQACVIGAPASQLNR